MLFREESLNEKSFSGQITNVAFLLSSQCKGAVAFGDYFVVLNYYVIRTKILIVKAT